MLFRQTNRLPYSISKYILLFGLVSILTSNGFAAPLVIDDNFEASTVNKPPNGKFWNCSGNCSVVSTEQSRNGKKSLKSYLNRNNSSVSYRTEIEVKGAQRQIKQGEHYWYGFSVFVPDSNTPDFVTGDMLAQWHATRDPNEGKGGKGGPAVALRLRGSSWEVDVASNPNQISLAKDRTAKVFNLGSYTTGVWTDWVFHMKWSWRGDGIVQVWKNGVKVLDHKGPNNYNDNLAPYLKLGLYKTGWRRGNEPGKKFDPNIKSRTYYHDEIKVGKGAGLNFRDVSPDGNNSSSNQTEKLKPPSNVKLLQ